MMTHDPFQNLQQVPGAYLGGGSPFGLPYTAFQPTFNPMGIAGQTQGNPGIGGYGIYPNPLQGAGITSQLAPLQQLLAWNALTAGLQNPLLQHLQAQAPWQHQQAGYQGWPQQQTQYGYPQVPQQAFAGVPGAGQPFSQQQYGYPQVPQQALGGAPGAGQPFGQQQYGYPQVPQQALTGAPGAGQPFGQQQYGYPLAPQSFIGSGGIGQGFGQIHPLAQQLALRQAGYF